MAIMRPGPLAGQLSGRVGGVVFSRNRGGDYIRNGPSPVNPQTARQVLVRNALTAASSEWGDLTADQRKSWAAWAASNPVQNRLGETIRLQPNAAFVWLSSRMVINGDSPAVAPPLVGAPDPLVTLGGTFDIGAGDFEVTFTGTPLGTNMCLWLQGCLLTSAAIMNVRNRLRVFKVSPAATASPYDIEADFEAVCGAATVGQTVVIRASVFDDRNGLLSSAIEYRGTVVST